VNVPESRPHWAARIEGVKNTVVGRTLDTVGWVLRIRPFSGYGTPHRVRVIARVLWSRPGTPADHHDRPVYDMRQVARRGWRNFTSQCAAHQSVSIQLGGTRVEVVTDHAGLVDTWVDVELTPGLHEAVLSTARDNAVTADVHVLDPAEDVGVISDIDDTVVVTWLPRPALAAWNAFVVHQSARQTVPGMPMLYQRILREHPSAPVLYVSTGAWSVFPVLRRFLYKNGFPEGPMLLTDWGPTNTGIFPSGRTHKEQSLEQLAELFPHVRWLLIGDDGQHDPEIYGDFARRRPEQVAAVAIRELSSSEQVLSHGFRMGAHHGVDVAVPWVQGPDGHALLEGLRQIGVVS
jgi:phosphatidate phosphatase APP1